MSYKDINEMRKQGRLLEALAVAEKEFAENQTKFEAAALFWCLNDQLKTIEDDGQAAQFVDRMAMLMDRYDPANEMMAKVLAIDKRMISPEGKSERKGWQIYHSLRQADLKEIDTRKHMLLEYLQLDLPRPSLLHSLIMAEAVKMEKCTSSQFLFTKFADMWGLDNLRDEDWQQPMSKDEHKFSSLAEKVIGAYVKEMTTEGSAPSEQFRALLQRAIDTYPTNLHLPRYQAQITARDGDKKGAIEKFKSLIIKNPDKFYLWDDLSGLVDDNKLEIGCLCGALLTNALDEFTVNIRLRLADLLCNMHYYSEAKAELDIVRLVHEQKNWQLKHKFFRVYNRLPRDVQPVDPRLLHLYFRDAAEQFIYSSLPSRTMVKVWEQRERSGPNATISWLLRCGDEEFWIKPKRFRLDFHTPNGTVFEVKTVPVRPSHRAAGQAGLAKQLVAWLRPCDLEEDLPWLRRFTAPLQVKHRPGDKLFGFVDQAFVAAPLLYGHSDGAPVTALAILNGTRWQALSLK